MNVAYLNGKKTDNLGVISLYNPSFLYGISVFEGIRSYWNDKTKLNIFLGLDEHLDRLFMSSNFIGFITNFDKETIKNELFKVYKEEKVKANCYIRITFFIGADTSWADENNIHYLISVRHMESNLDKMTPITLCLSTFNRVSSSAMPSCVKAGANYLNSRYALLEAKRKGYQGALFVSENNYISESTGSCVFFIRGNKIITPSESSDILVGITRNKIIELCKKNDIEVSEENISPPSIYSYDAAFLAGTMIEIKPISKIETKSFNTLENPIFRSIADLFKNYIYG